MADEITDAALDAATDALLDRVLGVGTTEGFTEIQRTYWRTNLTAALPHLTAERDAEIEQLRARDAAWKAYAADLAQLITSIGFDAWRGVDKGQDVLDDIYQATVVPPLPAVLADPAPSAPTAQETQA